MSIELIKTGQPCFCKSNTTEKMRGYTMGLNYAVKSRISAEIVPYLPGKIKRAVMNLDKSILQEIEEIRLRAGKPVMLLCHGRDLFLGEDGQVSGKAEDSYKPTVQELAEMVFKICENSWYAYQDDINKGFITIRGGHRIGLVGTPIVEGGRIINIRDISSLNVRIAREVIGCGEQVVNHILKGRRDVFNTLIISPPGVGKTTLLRDIIRYVSNGSKSIFDGLKVGVVDERGEIAACYGGIPQNDLGCRTDVIHGVHKQDGMEILLRSMSPNVISLDELGNPDDVSTVLQVMNAGIRIIATAHGYDVKGLKVRRGFTELFLENCFERFIVISKDSKSRLETKVMDGEENVLAMDCKNHWESSYSGELNNGRFYVFPKTNRKDRIYTGNTGILGGFGE